jgi:arylsulfatase A-like enzyme
MGVWSISAIALAAVACGASPSPHPRSRPDVLVVSIDSLRADHLGCYGAERDTSPTIDLLAEQGVRFETVVSTTSWTLPAHAALFTGLYDPAHGTTDVHLRLSDGYVTLAERFRTAGWRTVGFFGGPLLHPVFGLDQGFDAWISCMSAPISEMEERYNPEALFEINAQSHRDVTGPRTVDAVRRHLATTDDTPLFIFVHLWDPHYDYIPPEPYDRLFDPDYDGSISAHDYIHNPAINQDMAPNDLEHIIALYDGEIRFTDDILGRILDVVDRARGGHDRLTIITADHGEEFFEHGGKGHQATLYEESIRVPLIFHWPGRLPAARLVGDPVSLIDVAPTVASLVDLPRDEEFQGIDLSPMIYGAPGSDRALNGLLAVGGRRLDSMRTVSSKMLRSNGVVAHLDLVEDPGELDLRRGPPEDRPDLPQVLDRLLESSRRIRLRHGGGSEATRPMDPELIERLRALGYLDPGQPGRP